MKILIATGIYPPDIGGPATYTKLISEELTKRGHNVRILTFGEPKFSIFNFQFLIFKVGRRYFLPIRYFLYVLYVLRLGKTVDVIYVQDPVSVGLPTALANIFLRKKLILKVVGDYAWEQAEQSQKSKVKNQKLDDFYPFKKENYSFKIRLLKKIQTWVARRASKIITPSFYLKNILTNGWKINPEKIKVIYNSFDISDFVLPAPPSVIPAIRQPAEGIQASSFRIVSIGRLVPWKGFDALIEIAKDLSNVELEIVGDGPQKENFQFSIFNFQLQNRIKMPGKLEHDGVIKKMCSSDLFVLNSAYEGLSHVILEAMACGLPVAVSRAGGNLELVGENEERGYLFEYNNKEQIKEKINYIISHYAEAKEKAKKAREFVAGLSKDKMIEKLEKELS